MKKIVITGGAGFIGSQLGFRLTEMGHDVLLLDNMYHGYLDNLYYNNRFFDKIAFADIRDPDLGKYFKGVDAVFHFAGISALPECMEKPRLAIDINVSGTANVLESARKQGVKKVIFSSTSAIYENTNTFPTPENDETEPNQLYCVTKKQAEMLCRSFSKNYGLNILITRYYNVYGPHMDFKRRSPPFVSYIVRELLLKRKPVLYNDGPATRDYINVDDVNDLHIKLLEADNIPSCTAFNVGSGKGYTVREIYAQVKELLQTDIEPQFEDSTKFWDRYSSLFEGHYPLQRSSISKEVNKNTLAAIGNAFSLLQWKPKVEMYEGLQNCINFVREKLEK